MFEAWLFALACRAQLPDTVDLVLSDLFSIFAYICVQRLAVEYGHLISCARSSKYCRFMVTNVGENGTFPMHSCFFNMDLLWFEEIMSGNGNIKKYSSFNEQRCDRCG